MNLLLMLLVSCVGIWLGLHFYDLLLGSCGLMVTGVILRLTNNILTSWLVVRFIGLLHLLVLSLQGKVTLETKLTNIFGYLWLRAIYGNQVLRECQIQGSLFKFGPLHVLPQIDLLRLDKPEILVLMVDLLVGKGHGGWIPISFLKRAKK